MTDKSVLWYKIWKIKFNWIEEKWYKVNIKKKKRLRNMLCVSMKGKSKENAALYQYYSQTNSKAVSRQAILASFRNWL